MVFALKIVCRQRNMDFLHVEGTEAQARLGLFLSGLLAMMQASGFECVVFDPFTFE